MATSSLSALLTALLIALLAVPAQCRHARRLLQNEQTVIAGKAIVITVEIQGQPPARMLAVHTRSGQRVSVQVADASQLAGLHTGMAIEVTGHWQQPAQDGRMQTSSSSSSSSSFQAASIRASGAAFAAPTVTAAAAATAPAGKVSAAASAAAPGPVLSTNKVATPDLSVIVIPLAGVAAPGQACPGTTLPNITTAQLKKVVFAEANPTGPTVGSTFNKCSFGKTRLTARNSYVADLVELPCSGTSNGVAWSMSTCNFDDFNGWSNAADKQLRDRGVPLDKYNYKVYLLPKGPCGFVGLGYTGCDGSFECRAWIGADFAMSPQSLVHELGHNLFLAHAGTVNEDGIYDDYGDGTSTMGYCCMDRCPNTPQAWQLGWITVQQLDGNTLRPGQTVTATLASQAVSARSGLRIVPTWVAGTDPVFLGYRTKVGGDAGLDPEAAGKVHVYTAPSTNTYDAKKTNWKGGLAAGDTWTDSTYGLVVRFSRITRAGALVSVCRKGGLETAASCAAGLDNDCNGLVGAADPACTPLLAKLAKRLRTVQP